MFHTFSDSVLPLTTRIEYFLYRHRWRIAAGILVLNVAQAPLQDATVWRVNLFLTILTLVVIVLGMALAKDRVLRHVFTVFLIFQMSSGVAPFRLVFQDRPKTTYVFGDYYNVVLATVDLPPFTDVRFEFEFSKLDEEFRRRLDAVLLDKFDLFIEVSSLVNYRACEVQIGRSPPIRLEQKFMGPYNWPTLVAKQEVREILNTGKFSIAAKCPGAKPMDSIAFRYIGRAEVSGRRDFVTLNGERASLNELVSKTYDNAGNRIAFLPFEFRDKDGLLRYLWF